MLAAKIINQPPTNGKNKRIKASCFPSISTILDTRVEGGRWRFLIHPCFPSILAVVDAVVDVEGA